MKIVVTGGSGYIGSVFIRHAYSSGHEVISLSKRPLPYGNFQWIRYDLMDTHSISLQPGICALVHFASSGASTNEVFGPKEVSSAVMLINEARKISAKFIFISSQTAREDAPTAYGRTKWAIEQHVINSGGVVIRPGQVYGGPMDGLYGELTELIKKNLLLPAFIPSPMVQPIHVDDLVFGVLNAITYPDLDGRVLQLGSIKPVAFNLFIAAIAKYRMQTKVIFFPVPTYLLMFFCVFAKKWSSVSRLRSLFELPKMNTQKDLCDLGVSLRSLSSGLSVSRGSANRQIMLECIALYRYLMRIPPKNSIVRDYVKIVHQLRGGKPLLLPRIYMVLPIFLSLLERKKNYKCNWLAELVWRLNAMTFLSEAGQIGAKRYLGIGRLSGFHRALFGISLAIFFELCWRSVGIILSPILNKSLTELCETFNDQP